jgi:hypothetical protein
MAANEEEKISVTEVRVRGGKSRADQNHSLFWEKVTCSKVRMELRGIICNMESGFQPTGRTIFLQQTNNRNVPFSR